ncbi:MAG: hypothetical protein ABF334_06385 [Akkermansiaceae bacterium]
MNKKNTLLVLTVCLFSLGIFKLPSLFNDGISANLIGGEKNSNTYDDSRKSIKGDFDGRRREINRKETPEIERLQKFAELYREIRFSNVSEIEKNEALRSLVEKYLNEIGIHAVIGEISKFGGLGRDRNSLLSMIFEISDGRLDELIALKNNFSDSDERRWAFGGILEKFIKTGISESSFQALLPLSGDEAEDFSYALANLAGISPEKMPLSKAFDYLQRAKYERVDYEKAVLLLVDSVSWQDADGVLEFVENQMSEDSDFLKKLTKICFFKKFDKNPVEALNEISEHFKNNPKGIDPQVFSEMINKLKKRDSDLAEEWLAEKFDTLAPISQDWVFAGLVDGSLTDGSFSSAWEKHGEIKNVDVRKKVESKIWHEEQRVVIAKARKNPRDVIDKIVSGDSQHEAYWIKDAFAIWVANDPKAACQWHETASSQLSEVEYQHIARVYADESLKANDLLLAREWLGLIREEKFRLEIQGKLNAALNKTE